MVKGTEHQWADAVAAGHAKGVLGASPLDQPAPWLEGGVGLFPLGMGSRDGLYLIPPPPAAGHHHPLLVMLHGAGAAAADVVPIVRGAAEAAATIVVAPDSRTRSIPIGSPSAASPTAAPIPCHSG